MYLIILKTFANHFFFISGSTSLIKDFVIQSSHIQIIEDVYSAIFHCICKL